MGSPRRLAIDAEQRFATGFVAAPVLDVAMDAGSILVLFGPSGAGKTTVLRQLAGLERPDRGVISFGGERWCDVTARIWRTPQQRSIGLVFQQPTLFPHLSVRGNVEFGIAAADGAVRARRSGDLMSVLGIDALADRRPAGLSGGEAQRVAVARALAPRPQLVLLDEPFAALDAPTRVRLRREVKAVLAAAGIPAVLVTHDRLEALAVGDRVAVMIDGVVRQVGATTDVFGRPVAADVAAALGVETVVAARVLDSRDGVVSIAVGAATIYAAEREPLAVGSTVYVCIRAEDVALELQSPAHASARNHLAARVTAVSSEGPLERISLECGFALDALITRQSREELQLAPGAAITAAVKATSIHVVQHI